MGWAKITSGDPGTITQWVGKNTYRFPEAGWVKVHKEDEKVFKDKAKRLHPLWQYSEDDPRENGATPQNKFLFGRKKGNGRKGNRRRRKKNQE